ncbi:hypothetical protein ABVT39_008566 [Epinephelus coioides]
MGAKEERQEAEESAGGLWGYLVFTSEKPEEGVEGVCGVSKGPQATSPALRGPSRSHSLSYAETFPTVHHFTSTIHQMKRLLNDLLTETETPQTCCRVVPAPKGDGNSQSSMWLLATVQLPFTKLCVVLQDCAVHLSKMKKEEEREERRRRRETADTLQLIESCWSETKSSVIRDQRSHLFVSFTSFLSKGVSGLENMLQTGDAVQSLCSIPKAEAVGTLLGKRHHCEPEQNELAAVAFVQMQLRDLWLTFGPVGSKLCICEEWRSHFSGYRK